MNTIPVPKNEQGRIAALKQYNILDTAAEQEFDNLAQLAAEICNTPVALINLIDETRQWSKASVGLTIQQIARDYSFCHYTILDDELFEVTNPLADSRFDKNPLVTGVAGIRFYAGVPLVNKDGYRLGTLCVMSPKHHVLNSYQRISLQILGSAVMSLMELRLEKKEAALYRDALDQVAGVAAVDPAQNIIYANDLFCKLTGLRENEIIGKNNNEIKLADMTQEQSKSILESIAERKIWKGTVKNQNIKGAVSWSLLTVIPVANNENELIKILFLRQEITDEVLLRERLEESEQLAKTGRWELNIFNRNTFWTPGMFELLDAAESGSHLASQSIMNFVSPADYERVNEANKRLLEKKTSFEQIEFRIITQKGREKDINAVVRKRFNSKGGLTGIFGTLADVTAEKAALKELKEKEDYISDLYNNTPCGHHSIDEQGIITNMNATELRWLGYHKEEVAGALSHLQIIHTEDRAAFAGAVATLKATGVLAGLHVRLLRKNGSFFQVHINGALMPGATPGARFTVQDVSALKALREQLEAAEKHIADFYNNAPCGYHSTNEDGIFTNINATELKWLGYDKGEVAGVLSFRQILHNEDRPAFDEALAAMKKTGLLAGLTVRLFRKNGSFFHAHINGALTIGSNTGAWFMVQDVSALTALQEQLETAQEKIEAQQHGADELLMITNLNGECTYASDRLKSATGCNDETLASAPFVFAWDGEWRDKTIRLLRKQLQQREPETQTVIPIKNHEGEKVWLEVTSRLQYTAERITGLRCTFYDVTKRVEVEEKLHEVAWIAMEAKDMQQTVLEKIRNEVAKPIEGVMGMIQMLGSTVLSVEQKVLAAGIKETAVETLKCIKDLLDASKARPTKIVSVPTEFELKALINSIIHTLKPAAEEKNIRFILQVDNKIPVHVVADKEILSKILMNLAGNALKFTENGSISIGVFQKSVKNETATLEFIVKDTGVGIAEDKLATVFETFAEEDRDPRREGGPGLGLTIAKQLVEQQNGEIKVKSQLGVGTTFSFTFHVKVMKVTQEVEEVAEEDAEENIALAGFHILLVEDNTMNQRIGRIMLENWGAQVTVADRGRKAVDLMKKNNYDLVLMDIQMPEMSGIEATTILRLDLNDNTPIMGMTVSEMQASRETCLRAGMNEYILKPLKPAELHRKVFALLNKPETKLREKPVNVSFKKEKITNVHYLRSITGEDVALTKEILEIYITKTPGLMEELEQNMANRNYKEAQAGAHYLKNSVGLLGADTLFHMFASVENQLNHHPPSNDTYELLEKMKGIILESIEESVEELRLLEE